MIFALCKVTILQGCSMTNSIDIKAKAPFPGGALSDFAPHAFTFDGVACASMESFLQSLKVADAAEQEGFCALPGPEAPGRGRGCDWVQSGHLFWRGAAVDRLSDDYQALLDRAYAALFAQASKFRAALAASGEAPLVHSLGKDDPTETILTTEEFCSRLVRLRARLKEG
jgi:predicted NAD-dependent protein-ADP-ribosyltransferase YbiA (DUF1768 family)